MKLPNLELAVVPEAKVTQYLLSPVHSRGKAKQAYFVRFGFKRDAWQTLAKAVQEHAEVHAVTKTEATPYGVRYVIEGALTTPDGRNPHVRVIWFIDHGEDTPRFVTAYPLKRKGRVK